MLQLGCQPGTAPREGTSFTGALAGPFESVPVQAGAPAIPAPALKPVLTLRSGTLRAKGDRTTAALACAGAPCTGTVTVRTATGKAITVTRRAVFSLRAGERKTIRLTLSQAAPYARAERARDRDADRWGQRHQAAEGAMKALVGALCALALVPASADAAAKRVVAIEWDAVENLHMLGIAPVGAADLRGYDTWWPRRARAA